jgi:hypothetical protein
VSRPGVGGAETAERAGFRRGVEARTGGIYYEAGFAQGLGLPVIFTVREDDLRRVHFDTRQYNYIAWQNPADLRERLLDRVIATMGHGKRRGAS